MKAFHTAAFLVGAMCCSGFALGGASPGMPSTTSLEYLGGWAMYINPGFLRGTYTYFPLKSIPVRIAFGEEADFGTGFDLFEGVRLKAEDTGTSIFADSGSDPDFDAIVELLTNGSPNDGVFHETNGAGGLWEETWWASRSHSTAPPDFQGYRIVQIALHVELVTFTSPGRDPNGDGNWTDYHTDKRFDFYGIRIPEPTALCLGLTAVLATTTRRW